MADEVRSIRITGGAVADMGFQKPKGRGRKKQEVVLDCRQGKVGGAALVFPTSQPAAVLTPAPQSEVKVPEPKVPETKALEPQTGGTMKQIKVELKKRHPSKKVKLHPKKDMPVKGAATTKKSRKFVLGVSALHKRMTRAKKIHHTVKKMPLDVLRKHLIQSKLIKETSKAPEAILRQIAADSELVGKKVL
jgi:hypothetical protein